MEPKPVDLPHLVRVCEDFAQASHALINGDKSDVLAHDVLFEVTKRAEIKFLTEFDFPTVLALLRRLGEAEGFARTQLANLFNEGVVVGTTLDLDVLNKRIFYLFNDQKARLMAAEKRVAELEDERKVRCELRKEAP